MGINAQIYAKLKSDCWTQDVKKILHLTFRYLQVYQLRYVRYVKW